MRVSKSVTLDSRSVTSIEVAIKKGKALTFSEFVQKAVQERLESLGIE